MYTQRRYFKSTKGENAEVIVGSPVAYTTQATIALFEANAAPGEIGIYDATANTLLTTALAAGQKYYTAVMWQINSFGIIKNQLYKSSVTAYDATRTRRTAYIAPVQQVTTISFSAAFVTYTNALIAAQIPYSITDYVNYAGITTIETTPGNEPYPTIDWDYEFDNPANVTVNSILTAIVARINNPLDIAQKDDGQQYSAVLAGNDGAGYTVTITAFYFQQHFRIALRGLLSAGTTVYTTGYKQGVGDSVSVSDQEAEGWIYAGVTTNYPGLGVPDEYGKPNRITVDGLTYNVYQLDPLRISKEPNPGNVWHYWAHIYIIVPVPVGGSTGARAASSPDFAIGTVLGFTLTP
ncbi:unnamed protein product [Sphagnum balticum]